MCSLWLLSRRKKKEAAGTVATRGTAGLTAAVQSLLVKIDATTARIGKTDAEKAAFYGAIGTLASISARDSQGPSVAAAAAVPILSPTVLVL